jgi:medium-chain acyl-[acyl-carrier-protein] hydrolase
MSNLFGSYEYHVNSIFVNTQRKLGLYSLLNFIQDVAWRHATERGFGFSATYSSSVFWVLTRQRLVMETWPDWGDKVRINTWIRRPHGPYVIRDFEIFANEKKVGECVTTWVMLGIESRRPVKDGIDLYEKFAKTEGVLSLDTSKIEFKHELKTVESFKVRNSDLDMNQHVNNTRYAQWVLDSIPVEWLSKYRLHEYEVNFLAEAKSGDVVEVQMEEAGSLEPAWIQFQGKRESDGKPVFSSRLFVSHV